VWPSALIAIALAFVVPWVLSLPWWGTFLFAAGVGYGTGRVTWAIWRRRHPVLPVREILRRQREAAPWN
jgi:hypothetical protein